VEAAVAAAGRTGIQAAIVIVGGPIPGNGHTHGGAVEDRAAIDAIARQRDDAAGALHTAQAEIVRLRAQLSAAPPATVSAGVMALPAPQNTTTVADFYAEPRSILGLAERAEKIAAKAGWETVGQVAAAVQAGEFATARLPKGEIGAVYAAVLGKLPASAGLSGTPSASPSAPSNGTAAAGVPAGHVDRSWPERLKAARTKEQKAAEAAARVAQLKAEMAQKFAGGRPADAAQAQEYDQFVQNIVASERIQAITGAQVSALIFALGLNAEKRAVNPALEEAGLIHLVQV
jgi:hypothetical protein